MQTVRIDHENPARVLRDSVPFDGIRQGSNVSLSPSRDGVRYATWTGHLGWRSLVLAVSGPAMDGPPTEVTLSAGSFADFQRLATALRERGSSIATTQLLSERLGEADHAVQDEMARIEAADTYLRRAFPEPDPSPRDERSYFFKYSQQMSKMQSDWVAEQRAAAVVPMTCYQRSTVSYAASKVRADFNAIGWLDAGMADSLRTSDENIATAVHGPSVMAGLLAAYSSAAAASKPSSGASAPADVSRFQREANDAADFASRVAAPRLKSVRDVLQEVDRRTADLNRKADELPDRIACHG